MPCARHWTSSGAWGSGTEVRKAAKCGGPAIDAGADDAGTSCYVTPHCDQGITCTMPSDCPAPATKCLVTTCDSFCCGTAQSGLCNLDAGVDGGADCPTCVQQMCATVVAACEANASCAALAECYAKCTNGACMTGCDTQYPGGVTGMNTLFACATQGCATECGL